MVRTADWNSRLPLLAFASLLLVAALWAQTVKAAPIFSPGALDPGATIIDFESMTLGTTVPITDGQVVIDSPTGSMKILPQGYTQYPGVFEGQYLGQWPTTFTFDFANPVSEFGVGVFDPNYPNTNLAAYDSQGGLLEPQIFVPTGSPGGGWSTFVGFVRANADIAQVVLTAQSGDLIGIDNVTYFREAAVPAPALLALLLVGLVGLAAARRRG
jgi:hypothetical protein